MPGDSITKFLNTADADVSNEAATLDSEETGTPPDRPNCGANRDTENGNNTSDGKNTSIQRNIPGAGCVQDDGIPRNVNSVEKFYDDDRSTAIRRINKEDPPMKMLIVKISLLRIL